ncbi:DoxX family protein [Corynebacterium sp. MSK041]|uniref:DoxX family protein n=1 Tax=Corynebacterium sp. MSK041 TaxID=3050194 RepID=UPI00254BF290|nr:DoxX family protein [Corynebacterium sp. MSK041]MDK8794636.1 DoxX family protein [Corynebacterium sp. MSK041]
MIRKLARPMLASVYIADGVNSVTKASEHAKSAEKVAGAIKSVLPAQYASFIPSDPETLVKIGGGVKIGAGSTFALGKAPRLSAALLAGSSVATLLGRNAFWEASNESEKVRQRNGALTNVALLGGVLIAAADTEGKPGLAWRAQDAAKRSKKNIQQALPTQSESEKALKKAGEWFQDTRETVTESAQQAAHQVADYVDDNKGDWKKVAEKWADKATDVAHDAADWAEDTYKDLKPSKVQQYKAKRQVKGLIGDVQDRVGDVQARIEDLQPSALDKFKAKRKVNSVVGDLQSTLDDFGPSALDKFKAKRKVKKSATKAQKTAQDAINTLQDAFENLDAAPSRRQKRKLKKKVKKAEKTAKKAVKKAEKKFK